MRCANTIALVFMMLWTGQWVSAAQPLDVPRSIVVITSDKRPLTGVANASALSEGSSPTVQVHNLDAVGRIERQLSDGLPPDEKLARKIVEQRLTRDGFSKLENNLRDAYQGLLVSLRYSLNRYPAIILDDRAVIYGVSDIDLAVQRYRAWYAEHWEDQTESRDD